MFFFLSTRSKYLQFLSSSDLRMCAGRKMATAHHTVYIEDIYRVPVSGKRVQCVSSVSLRSIRTDASNY